MQRATVVSDFPILAGSVVRQLGTEFLVECMTWNEFPECSGCSESDLLVVDVTTVGERVGLDLVHAFRTPTRIAIASLHTNEVRLYRLEGTRLLDDGKLSSLLVLEV